MGWNSWNQFACNINETLILETVNSLLQYKLDEYGYKYINIDDCWQLDSRDSSGHVIADPKTFPSGMSYLSSYIHSKGLKFGLYTDIGYHTCQHRIGSFGSYDVDAETYSDWGVDYIKVDYCYPTMEQIKEPWISYKNFSTYLNMTKKPVYYSICNWGQREPYLWAGEMSNQWRTTEDIKPNWEKIMHVVTKNSGLSKYTANYQFNDPDMLEIGVTAESSLDYVQSRTHFSLWCMMAAPLILGLDVRNIKDDVLQIITNQYAISVDQDDLGVQGVIVTENKKHVYYNVCTVILKKTKCIWTQVWKKRMTQNRVAILLFNHAALTLKEEKHFKEERINVLWSDIDVEKDKKFRMFDVWQKKEIGVFKNSYTSQPIAQHDIQMLILTPL